MLINQAETACAVFHASNFQPQQQRILDLLECHGGDWTIGEPHASSAQEMESFRCKLRQQLSYLLDEREPFKEAA